RRQNGTTTGTVTDDSSGVAALQAAADGGTRASVAFDAAGNFSYTTTFALNGSSNGTHTVAFVATDHAGNTSAPVDYSFSLSLLGATPLDTTVATTIGAATSFLYTGSDPVQVGVAPGTINPVQAAVLRGKVL